MQSIEGDFEGTLLPETFEFLIMMLILNMKDGLKLL